MIQRSALPLSAGKNYKVITLCGSTRFKNQFLDEPSGRAERIETQKRLTLEGCIVISVGLFGHSGDEEVWKPGTKEMLDDMHKRKIDMADEIFVINVGGYIGESTKSEDTLKVPSVYRGLRLVYQYDDRYHEDFNVSEELNVEYYD